MSRKVRAARLLRQPKEQYPEGTNQVGRFHWDYVAVELEDDSETPEFTRALQLLVEADALVLQSQTDSAHREAWLEAARDRYRDALKAARAQKHDALQSIIYNNYSFADLEDVRPYAYQGYYPGASEYMLDSAFECGLGDSRTPQDLLDLVQHNLSEHRLNSETAIFQSRLDRLEEIISESNWNQAALMGEHMAREAESTFGRRCWWVALFLYAAARAQLSLERYHAAYLHAHHASQIIDGYDAYAGECDAIKACRAVCLEMDLLDEVSPQRRVRALERSSSRTSGDRTKTKG